MRISDPIGNDADGRLSTDFELALRLRTIYPWGMQLPRINFNAPVVLGFTFVCVAVLLLDQLMAGTLVPAFFSLGRIDGLTDYFRLATYPLGHAGWTHLVNNLTFILLLGPALEERYGSQRLLAMILITAVASGLLNVFLFNTGLVGASGIVFMFILLGSFTSSKAGTIPLTFLLVAPLFLTREIVAGLQNDNVSQFAHLLGGGFGALFGFYRR